jgi:23S rRNA (cytidine1920-2'-O)/16S rRNA (cytidine1409-2'-O)-methyltransferase
VLVDGFPVRNPRSLVRAEAHIALREDARLRGEAKLEAALAEFDVEVAGRVAVDVGAAAGGFTRVLLGEGARRVYAVDVGYGQLLGSLRQDERVVVLERTNLAQLDRALVPDVVAVVAIDVSYVSLAAAVPQLGGLEYAAKADLVALVKPMFELRLAEPPKEEAQLDAALAAAVDGIAAAGWHLRATSRSPVAGANGAVELLLHARRRL